MPGVRAEKSEEDTPGKIYISSGQCVVRPMRKNWILCVKELGDDVAMVLFSMVKGLKKMVLARMTEEQLEQPEYLEQLIKEFDLDALDKSDLERLIADAKAKHRSDDEGVITFELVGGSTEGHEILRKNLSQVVQKCAREMGVEDDATILNCATRNGEFYSAHNYQDFAVYCIGDRYIEDGPFKDECHAIVLPLGCLE